MTRWEYASLAWNEVFKDGKWERRVFTFSGPGGSSETLQPDDESKPNVIPLLNKLGKEGWDVYHIETVNHVYYNKIGEANYPTAQPIARVYFLKRPIL